MMTKLNHIHTKDLPVNSMETKKKWLTRSNIITAFMLLFVLAMFISPKFKGVVIQGLMKIGLFQPNVPEQSTPGSSGVPISEKNTTILFKDENGKIISLSDLKGKVAFINFWATWCPPCIAEMPSINQLKAKFIGNKDVIFLMVDVDNNPEKSQKFMKQNKYNLQVYTPASVIPEQLFQGSFPTTLILNKKGEIVYDHEGMADYSSPQIEKFLNDLSK
jgi:thiol-disulfide isomerase/thioredoxin